VDIYLLRMILIYGLKLVMPIERYSSGNCGVEVYGITHRTVIVMEDGFKRYAWQVYLSGSAHVAVNNKPIPFPVAFLTLIIMPFLGMSISIFFELV